jgi:hypothetical protein
MRAAAVVCLYKVSQEGDELNSLAQAHFIRKNAVDVRVVQNPQPIQAHQLVILEPHLVVSQTRGLPHLIAVILCQQT